MIATLAGVTLEYRTITCRPDDVPMEPHPGSACAVSVPDDFRRWRQAVQIGFHQNRSNPRSLELYYEEACADGWTLRGFHDTSQPPGALSQDYPVATYASFVKDMNIGAAKPLPTHMITEVTVRPTHRRRGILRRMMTDDLAEAKENGLALAALTATEATIYGRFGFGPTTFINRIEVKTDVRFRMRTQPTGSIHLTSRDQLVEIAPEVFALAHAANVGSVGRTRNYAYVNAGRWSFADQNSDDTVRNIIHRNDRGEVDGYASYSVTDDITRARTLTIRDLCAVDANAHLALFAHLASIDLVERVRWKQAPVHDPLEWVLEDRRCYRVTERTDLIWTRVLDPIGVLSARSYPGVDADLLLHVDDPMGFAAGTFHLRAEHGSAAVERSGESAEVTVGADALASLFLGGIDARTLRASGRLNGTDAGVAKAQQLFTSLGAPYANTYF